ncbi:Pre-mRNA-processing protein 40C [Rhynchospora pubera]|uniref:Pre-mRNA-processing protein 40C n=1 Tax=Rhynchospora pubera TaxID=906938 RepID=A0AAV8EY05_9POAL|nr:Pre-mRNA-processing protein 40C [Rhynchospora pubera]
MSTTEPPAEEVQPENSNEMPDAQIVDQSMSGVTPVSKSPVTESLASATPASMATSASSSQALEPGPSTPITIPNPPTSSAPRGIVANPNVAPQDHVRPGIANGSFSFGAFPRPNLPFGANQQPPMQTVMRPAPPISPVPIQPPVPNQYMGNRPPFGYNMGPHGTSSSSPSQQFQPNNVNSMPMIPSEPYPSVTAAGSQTMQMQPGPSFPRPETVGVPGNPVAGQPNFHRPITPSPALMQTPQPVYPNQIPGHGPVLQPNWPHQPTQTGVFQRAPLLSNPGTMPVVQPPVVLPNVAPSSAPTLAQRSVESQTGSATTVVSTFSDQTREANQVSAQEEQNVLNVWTAHKTEAGLIYYYNSLTGKSTYEKPVGFKGEPEKISGQSTPVSWEKLPGTDWTLVTTNDGKKYYYDSKNKVSSWKIPPEVAEILKKQQMDSANDNTTELQNQKPLVSNLPAVLTGGREAVPLRQAPSLISSSALDTIKKKLQDAGTPGAVGISDLNGSKIPDGASADKPKEGNGDGNVSDSSSDSDDGESGSTKEDCLLQFKEMLKEKGVPPFAKWDKELPKIIFDPRFKAVPTNEGRRAIFERYVRTRADEERKERKAAQKAAIEGFRQLLEEASEDIDHKTNFSEFKKKWGDDSRFKALESKEREALFNEKVQAAEEKVRAIHLAAIAEFKSMLCERNEITSKSRWSKVKEELRSDKRYKAVKHEERETLFEEYVAELKAAEEEVEQSSKAILDEQEKLRERERETRKRKEREEQEMERVRLKIRKKEAVASYQALLVEKIKDAKISWSDAKAKLEKDPQGRATNPDLAHSDAEMLFREHVTSLYNKQVHDYRQLLSEVITTDAAGKVASGEKTVFTSWSEAKKLLQSDARYAKLSSKDCESLWRRFVEDMARKLKNVLGDLKEKPDKDSGSDSKEKERMDRDHRRDSLERERSNRDHRRDSKEVERSDRDYRRETKEVERSDRDYRRDSKERERSDRDYRRDTKEKERSERDHRRDRKENERSGREYRRGNGSSDHSRRR